MKSRISFFNLTALGKDITRFLPVWLLYLIGGLLIGMDVVGYSSGEGSRAYSLSQTIGAMAVFNLVYALLCAELLFGDLFNSKLCNALHALPLRRESWFVTHTAAGLLFSLVPNFVLSLYFMLFMDGMWYISLIWLLGVMLQYLFFFGLAALSAVCTGNRIGMAAVYAIANFLSMIAAWFVATFYEPQLYGLHLRYDSFGLFCPSVWVPETFTEMVKFDVETRTEMIYSDFGSYEEFFRTYIYKGFGEGWGYLTILAVLGLAFLGLGVVLYRRRKLESAGDFIAFRPMMPVFTVIFTLSAGAVFQLFGDLFINEGNYLFLIVGIIVGYFGCQMLMQRTVKVFRKKAFLKCAAIGGALLLSIVITALDPFGVTRWVPEANEVESIILTDDYTYDPDWAKEYGYNDNALNITNPVLIEELVGVHQEILAEESWDETEFGHDVFYYDGYYYADNSTIHLTYKMKDGREIERRYYYRSDGEASEKLQKFFGSPEYVLGYDDWEEFLSGIEFAYVDWGEEINGEDARSLAEAIKLDCETGNMIQTRTAPVAYSVNLHFQEYAISIYVYEDSENTVKWIKDHGFSWEETEKYG